MLNLCAGDVLMFVFSEIIKEKLSIRLDFCQKRNQWICQISDNWDKGTIVSRYEEKFEDAILSALIEFKILAKKIRWNQ